MCWMQQLGVPRVGSRESPQGQKKSVYLVSNNYLLSTYYEPGSVLGVVYMVVSKSVHVPPLTAHILITNHEEDDDDDNTYIRLNIYLR